MSDNDEHFSDASSHSSDGESEASLQDEVGDPSDAQALIILDGRANDHLDVDEFVDIFDDDDKPGDDYGSHYDASHFISCSDNP